MGSSRIPDSYICKLHWSEYIIAVVTYKQRTVAKIGTALVAQFASTIFVGVVVLFSPEHNNNWTGFTVFWCAFWPALVFYEWARFVWRFRRSNWDCATRDETEHNDPADFAEDNEAGSDDNGNHLAVIYDFPYSDN